MSEINEDNCVLDEYDFDMIDTAFRDFLKVCNDGNKRYFKPATGKIISKIHKLNELAKEGRSNNKSN